MVDVASRSAVEQSAVVEETLRDLDIVNKPRVTVLNKADLLLPGDREWDESAAIEHLSDPARVGLASENTVLVSATRKWGLARLLDAIGEVIGANRVTPLAQTIPATHIDAP